MNDDAAEADLDRLLSQLFDGTLSPKEHRQLDHLLATSEAARNTYFNFVEVHSFLRKQLAVGDDFDAVAAAPRASLASYFLRPQRLALFTATLAVGLLLLLMGVLRPPLGVKFVRPDEADTARYVATLTDTYHAQWGEPQQAMLHGSRFKANELIHLEAGFAEITFVDGAKVLLEAPVKLVVREEGAATLLEGVLVAHVPPQAVGYTIEFKWEGQPIRVVDLGTEFAVQVSPRGDSEVHVLDGVVEVFAGGRPQRLTSRQALKLSQGKIHPRASTPNQFARSLPRGNIPVVTGAIKFLSTAPSSMLVDRMPRGNDILVFAERIGQVTPKELPLSFAAPGEYTGRRAGLPAGAMLPAGTKVDSYFVSLGPLTKGQYPAQGKIVFPQPIVGVQIDDDEMLAADPWLGHPQVKYSAERAVEEEDKITLLPDRRTVLINLSAAGNGMDQLRVITESWAGN